MFDYLNSKLKICIISSIAALLILIIISVYFSFYKILIYDISSKTVQLFEQKCTITEMKIKNVEKNVDLIIKQLNSSNIKSANSHNIELVKKITDMRSYFPYLIDFYIYSNGEVLYYYNNLYESIKNADEIISNCDSDNGNWVVTDTKNTAKKTILYVKKFSDFGQSVYLVTNIDYNYIFDSLTAVTPLIKKSTIYLITKNNNAIVLNEENNTLDIKNFESLINKPKLTNGNTLSIVHQINGGQITVYSINRLKNARNVTVTLLCIIGVFLAIVITVCYFTLTILNKRLLAPLNIVHENMNDFLKNKAGD